MKNLQTRSSTTLKFLKSLLYLQINNDSVHLNSTFTINEFELALASSNSKSVPVMDYITFDMLSNLPYEHKFYLLSLFNESWLSNVIPKIWKCSISFPILKKNKIPSDPSSYRPISVTSTVNRLYEKMVAARLSWYLDKNN